MNQVKSVQILIFACIVGLLARLYLAQYLTFQLDLDSFKYWSYYLADHGLKSFYANVWSDYLPGYHYVLWLLGEVRLILISNSISFKDTGFFKIPSIMADILSSVIVFFIVKKLYQRKKLY